MVTSTKNDEIQKNKDINFPSSIFQYDPENVLPPAEEREPIPTTPEEIRKSRKTNTKKQTEENEVISSMLGDKGYVEDKTDVTTLVSAKTESQDLKTDAATVKSVETPKQSKPEPVLEYKIPVNMEFQEMNCFFYIHGFVENEFGLVLIVPMLKNSGQILFTPKPGTECKVHINNRTFECFAPGLNFAIPLFNCMLINLVKKPKTPINVVNKEGESS